jgi:hypothetical protein
VLSLDALKVLPEDRDEAGGQHRQAVLAALAVADEDLGAVEVHVLDAEPAALEQAQAAAVHERAHQPGNAPQVLEHGLHLAPREHQRQVDGARFARRGVLGPASSRPSTSRYRNRIAAKAWFWVDASRARRSQVREVGVTSDAELVR